MEMDPRMKNPSQQVAEKMGGSPHLEPDPSRPHLLASQALASFPVSPFYIGADVSHGLVEVSPNCFFMNYMNCRNLKSGQAETETEISIANNGHLLEFLERKAFHGDSS
jgi:hypothetical protein